MTHDPRPSPTPGKSDEDARVAAFQAFRDAKKRGNSEDVALAEALNAYASSPLAGLSDDDLSVTDKTGIIEKGAG